jgi:multidrug resistance efflux pump
VADFASDELVLAFCVWGDHALRDVMRDTRSSVRGQVTRWAATALPVVLIAGFLWFGWFGRASVSQPAASPPADAAMSAPGRVEGRSDVLSLGTSVTGTIAELLVGPGTRVAAGQHLVKVECGPIERELDARKSDLEAAEAGFLRTLHGPRREEIAIGIANVNLADARLREAQRSLDRIHALHEGFTVTRVQIDQAERDARMAAALLDEVHAKLALLNAGSREEDITETRSRRDAARRRVEESAARLGRCSVDAPTAGVVLATNVSPGQLVSTMAPVILLTMVDDSTRRIRAYVDERDVPRLCLGQHARVTADGVPGMQSEGVVESIGVAVGDNPLAANASRQFRQVMLSAPDAPQQLPIGLKVAVQFSPCPPGQGAPRQ